MQKIHEYCNAFENTRAYATRCTIFYHFHHAKSAKKKHGGVLIKLYLMTKNTLAQDYPNHFARFDIYAQNFTAFMLSQFFKVIMITRVNL